MCSMNSNAGLYDQDLSYPENSPPYQCLTQPWFVRVPHPVYYPRYRCSIEPLICGEKVFRRIANDLKRARHSVDIITWGFDPGMILVRGATGEAGQRYGDLLREIATRKKNPVTVRLLVWHDDVFAHYHSNNNPGFYGERFPCIGANKKKGFYSESHQDFNAEWYAQVCANNIPNIHFHVRDVPTRFIDQSLLNESPPSGWMVNVAERYATHHQKMVLIDYEDPARAIGYVMGHNSITDFWDTEKHLFRDPRRERFYTEDHATLQKAAWNQGHSYGGIDSYGYVLTEQQQADKERLVQAYIDKHSHITKPYQDVSCRLLGPVLYDLNHNFCDAWEQSQPPNSLFVESYWLVMKKLVAASPTTKVVAVGLQLATQQSDNADLGFIKSRRNISLSAHSLPGGQHSVQLLRTQPIHGEKAIKECYANLTRQTLHYIFIQNQYIQYQDWAEHLIECVGRLRNAGYLKPIYVFILTSTPEDDGMDRPTYAVASKVGMSKTMKVEHEQSVKKARKKKTRPPITPEELAVNGINVVMGSLWTCAQTEGKLRPTDYEEIYIHAKVAIVDDAAFTIGSANLNLRSMALDSELNVLSNAKDVTYQLRTDLFSQCTMKSGPAQFGDMQETFREWQTIQRDNDFRRKQGQQLKCQLLPFYVDRKPGQPVV